MTIHMQRPCTEGQLHPADSMNVNLLTILSKLVIALVLGIVVMII